MSTINEALLEEMEKAINAAERWTGQKAKRMTLVTERGEPIHYQFGIGFEIAPGETGLTPSLIIAAIEAAMKRVGEFISANCHEHFVRAEPEISHDTNFDTKAHEWLGYMRGTMIGVGADVGPAKAQKAAAPETVSFAKA